MAVDTQEQPPEPYGVDYARDGAVALITLNRPRAGNALDTVMKGALRDALHRAGGDDSVRAVLIAAEGRSFCVGQDLKEHAAALEQGPETALATVREDYNPLIEAVHALRVPVLAAVEGACVGAGLGLALAADLRIAGEGAGFATAFAGIGLAADSGLSAALARAVGPSRALGLFLLGDTVRGPDAVVCGLAHRMVPDGTAREEALTLARQLAEGPTLAYGEIKTLLREAGSSELPAVLEREAASQVRLGATEDHRLAVATFLERGKPTFHGR
ncbi:enoyl-CoA hydratase/isomerase family protein [Streptomyces sp. NPDC058045]|uniref:enoyl-CoA hydratase/isomerase family protein n=1 Tax=Streptomyces sp. NPDC058045 TaxID=3346311 RepID=UPI0036E0AE5A